MPLDFDSLADSAGVGKLLSPREIFIALPGKDRSYEYLRDGQGQVLEQWEQRRAERDLAIKMNTGAGKTVVGLLILRACLNEGLSPVLYVAPDNYLVHQVGKQAQSLGLSTVADVDDSQYLSGEAIGVVNIHKLINGRSVFGGPGNSRPRPLPIGAVIIDDAHAALATVDEQASISIPSSHALFGAVLELFESDLSNQSPGKLLAIKDGDPNALIRVPFWAWSDRSSRVLEALWEHKEEDLIRYALPFLADLLPICQAVFTGTSLEIKPPCPPVDAVRSFAAAQRKIFLSATLADDSVLVSTFDADPDGVGRPITPATAADLGDRLILAPQEINPGIAESEIKAALAELAREYNVVVLVPSARRARLWTDVAAVVAAKDEIAQAVEDLGNGHVGLVVLINKYDGIDLPDDACRILVIDGLPEAYGAIERREAQILGSAMIDRQLQRVEQGMGRGVRSANDFCVVILHGARLSECIALPRSSEIFSPATRAQMAFARQVKARLAGQSLVEIVAVMLQCLNRDDGFVRASRAALAGVTYSPGAVSPIAAKLRKAFNLSARQQYSAASSAVSDAINLASEERLRGALQELQATYTHQYDSAQAQHILARAVVQNPSVLKPRDGVSFQRLSAAQNQAQACAAYLSERFSGPNQLLVGAAAVLEDLEFDEDTARQFEDAMEQLGMMLGFQSQRPERDLGNGPDVMWAVGELQYLIIECKSGATSGEIYRSAMAQLSHSMNWFGENYPSCDGRPILVHPVNQLAHDAVAPEGTRVLTRPKLATLVEAVNRMMTALANSGAWDDSDLIATQLTQHQLNGSQIAVAYSVPARR